jgi:probable HAF family extracellular repeat protein
MNKLHLLISTCLALLLTPLAMAQTPTQHAFIWDSTTGMTDIGTLGGATSNALGINDSGQVVGYSYLADNVTVHAFIWTAAGGMVDLGTDAAADSRAWAINSAGNVVGDNDYVAGSNQTPFYWSPSGGFVLVGTSHGYNFAFGINDLDEVTGQIYGTPSVHAFIWSPTEGGPQQISQLAGGDASVGNAINNLHHITGTANIADGGYVAFVWNRSGGMRQIAAIPNGTYTAGEAINDNDEIVGIGLDARGRSKGFYWSRATGMTLLPTLGGRQSAGFGINNSGVFAGYASNSSEVTHAVTWASNTSAPTDLGTLPGGTNSYARAINSLGQVAGVSDVP